MNLDDTIVAIATPSGRGGLGVVRLAGAEAKRIALFMLRLKHAMEPGRAVFGELVEPEARGSAAIGRAPLAKSKPESEAEVDPADHPTAPGKRTGVSVPHPERIDEVVVTYFAKPHSYTTDDIVEISAHGSPVVLHHIVELALSAGARLAEPGEFTMRAFLNGRMDLTQAEAVRDLIDSQTLFQAKVAAQQLEGALSRRLQPIKQSLVNLIAVLEAGIDFAEDDISVLPGEQIVQRISEVRFPLQELAASFAYGKFVHQGLTLAIVGRPNVGKSSLFNRLVERERAIVTATPGTTRDLVSETTAIGGIPIKLVDTAGIRKALDEAESIGIRKSMEALAEADLVLIVLDATQPVSAEDEKLFAQAAGRPALVVINKSDLSKAACDSERSQAPPNAVEGPAFPFAAVRTSALTGAGIPELRDEILRHICGESATSGETAPLTNLRHQKLVEESITALDTALAAVGHSVPHEMLLLDLYGALRALDEITGATTRDDILNLIFSSFCIGK